MARGKDLSDFQSEFINEAGMTGGSFIKTAHKAVF